MLDTDRADKTGRSGGLGLALCGAAIITAALFATTAASPATRGPNAESAPPPTATEPPGVAAIEELRLSDGLADFGERHADPLALVEAAQIRKLLPRALSAPSGADPGAITWQSLLARAAQLSGGSPVIAGLINDVRASRGRDIPSLSADVHLLNRLIKQGATDRAEVRFKAGEIAVVYVRPQSSQLTLLVYDEFNNLICSHDTSGNEAFCRWRPRWDGRFLLDIHNETGADVPYVLAINHEVVAH